MHRAAVWQRSSNTNIKIVHKSIEHFLWNQSDLFFDDVLSCLWINFTNSVSQVPLQKIDRRVEILGLGWSGLLVWREMSLSHGKLCLRYSSVLFEKWGGTSFLEQNRAEQNNWIPQAKFRMGQTHFTSDRDLPRSQPAWGNTWKAEFVKTIHRQEREIIRREIRLTSQEMLNIIVNNFNVRVAAVLSYSSAVHGTNIVLITEKV